MQKTIYPLEYKMIPTQHCFLVSKENGKYKVQVSIVTTLTDKVFDTEKEARKFINQKEII